MRRLVPGGIACVLAFTALAAPPAAAARRKAAAAPATLEQRLLAIAKHPPVRRSEAGIVVVRVGDATPLLA
ncbi:MAG TPA: hypothetical protein VMN04_02045, partial [Thermoanaerobaculia bacterium]|nr:hypothetical protein [Thermoanaerobaculia bacterium]